MSVGSQIAAALRQDIKVVEDEYRAKIIEISHQPTDQLVAPDVIAQFKRIVQTMAIHGASLKPQDVDADVEFVITLRNAHRVALEGYSAEQFIEAAKQAALDSAIAKQRSGKTVDMAYVRPVLTDDYCQAERTVRDAERATNHLRVTNRDLHQHPRSLMRRALFDAVEAEWREARTAAADQANERSRTKAATADAAVAVAG